MMEKFNQKLKIYRLPILFSLVGIVLIVGGLISSNINLKPKTASLLTPKENFSSNMIKIDISGAVVVPGVYALSVNNRVEDAIKLAGGFSDKADPNYISKNLNLSQKLSDGQKLYIPFTGENSVAAGAGSSSNSTVTSSSSVISLNSSSQSELDSLPGVGAVTAQKIIDNRPYTSVDDLLAKKVVSKSVYSKIKNSIEVN